MIAPPPERVEVTKTSYAVADFVDWQRQGSLELRPAYQRRSVWNPRMKSLLIDSLLRGYPIPLVFLTTRIRIDDGRVVRQVVDGQQRLRTILSFIDPALVSDPDDWDAFTLQPAHARLHGGARYTELAPALQHHVLQSSISVNVLPSDVDEVTVLKIFQRMNSTGLRLTEQEIRNGTWFGEFKECAYRLAYEQNSRWLEWGLFTRQQMAQMAEVEFVSDLLGLVLRGVSSRSRRWLDSLYRDHDEAFPERDAAQTRLRELFEVLAEVLGDATLPARFRSPPWVYAMAALVWGVPTSGGRAGDIVAVTPRDLALRLRRADLALADRALWRALPESLRRQTTHRTSREERIEFLRAV